MEKNLKNIYIYVCVCMNNFAVYLKLTHYKSTSIKKIVIVIVQCVSHGEPPGKPPRIVK